MERYLSPKEVAAAIGVSESSLKRWADEGLIRVTRTGGGHRRILLSDALDYIRRNGVVVVRPDLLGVTGPGDVVPSQPGDISDGFIAQAVRSGQLAALRAALAARFLAGASLGALCDGPLASALHQVGDAWKSGPAGIQLEHRASEACVHGLNFLRGLLPAAAQHAPLALGGAPAGDPYQVPSLMAAAVMAGEGWREINLGPNLPFDALAAAALEHRPELIWISFSSASAARATVAELRGVEKLAREVGAHLVIGGQALSVAALPDRSGLHVLTSMQALAAFARGILTARRAAPASP